MSKFNILKGWLIGLMVVLSGCNAWLEVTPEDRIMEDDLFVDGKGFLKALNGVYAEMNTSSLYGSNLSMGLLDVMAQYYNAGGIDNHSYNTYATYDYTQSGYKSRISSIWSGLYSLIANCNVIIEKCGDGTPLLNRTEWAMMKGEALALRAMMHFDLLRMFGPVYREDTKSVKCMPYMTSADRNVQPLITAEAVLGYVTDDLEAAEELLKEVDPVVTEGPKNFAESSGDNSMNYRQYRLNYFAVQALLARAYLWGNDKAKAFTYATNVITACQKEGAELFPFIAREALITSYPDRIFSTEVLFSTYNTSRVSTFNSLFASNLASTAILTLAGGINGARIEEMYDDENDYRKSMWTTAVVNSDVVTYCQKYRDVSDTKNISAAFRYMIPLIRLSEMYLIAAECTADQATAAKLYLNKVRLHRGCIDLQPTDSDMKNDMITAEFRREFLGEGQMFFYYKRKGMQILPEGKSDSGNFEMKLNDYVFPLPDSEASQRTDVNN